MGIHPVQGAVGLDQFQGALFTDAGNTLDIIGGIALDGLDVDQLGGLQPEFFLDGGGIVDLHLAGTGPGDRH